MLKRNIKNKVKPPKIFIYLDIGEPNKPSANKDSSMRDISTDPYLSVYIGDKKQLEQETDDTPVKIYIPIVSTDSYNLIIESLDLFGIDALQKYVSISKDRLHVQSADQSLIHLSTFTELNIHSILCLIYPNEKYNYRFNQIIDIEPPKSRQKTKTAEFIIKERS